jgi:hypothetical protein
MASLFLLLLAIASSTLGIDPQIYHPLSILYPQEVAMPASLITVKDIHIVAREQRKTPIGKPSQSNRDIGFATVFLTIENLKQKPARLVVQKIQIRDAENVIVPMDARTPQEIILKPLEQSITDFHLTNKIGYSTHYPVKAVVTYQFDQQTHTIESNLVEIERN